MENQYLSTKQRGELLKKIRLEKNLSTCMVQESTGINRSNLSRWETGKQNIEISKLAIISLFYNVTTDYLIFSTKRKFFGNNLSLEEIQKVINSIPFKNELELKCSMAVRLLNDEDMAIIMNKVEEILNKNQKNLNNELYNRFGLNLNDE